MHPHPYLCGWVAAANAAFNLPSVLVPETVQSLLRILTTSLEVQRAHNLLYVSKENPVLKPCPFLSSPACFPLYPHVACPSVKRCLFIVQHQCCLASVSQILLFLQERFSLFSLCLRGSPSHFDVPQSAHSHLPL